MAERLTAGEPGTLRILYRGPLPSCNYACDYCPFSKHRASAEELAADRRALARFMAWAAEQTRPLEIFFTPWGEALVHAWYREAMIELGRLPHVDRVIAQTNLSCRLDWLDRCDRTSVAFWCSYHPSQVRRARFVEQCRRLDTAGLRYSVGMVGLREQFDEAIALRAALPEHVYLWINAFKDQPNYYSEGEIAAWERIDPHFRWNTVRHPSFGRPCRTGNSVITVDGDGTVRRCHFIPQPLGNLYDKQFQLPGPRVCSNQTCGCHIGYVHMDELRLDRIFAGGILERIPAEFRWLQRDQIINASP